MEAVERYDVADVGDNVEDIEKNKIRAVGFARVSTREQAEGGYSLEAQKKLIKNYANKQNLELDNLFEVSESAGRKKRRQHFDSLINYIQENDISDIIFEKTDRACRNLKDYAILDDLRMKYGRRIHFINENEILDADSGSNANMVFAIKVIIAKQFLDNLSEEVRKGLRTKCEKGHYPCRAPYGYKINSETKLIEIHPEESVVVKKIFKLYGTGSYSLRELAAHINKKNYSPIKRKNSSGLFSPVELSRIIKRPLYYGSFLYKGKLQKGKHEALVPYELYEKCNDILSGRVGKKRSSDKKAILSALLYNQKGHCFWKQLSRFSVKRKDGSQKTYEYYIYGVAYENMGHSSRRKYVGEKMICNALDKLMGNIEWSDEIASQKRIEIEKTAEKQESIQGKKSKHRKEEIPELKERRKRLVELYLEKQIDKEDYTEIRAKIEKEISEGYRIIEKNKQENWLRGDALKKSLEDFSYHYKMYGSVIEQKEKIEILRKICQKIIIHDNRDIELKLKAPYCDFLSNKLLLLPYKDYKSKLKYQRDIKEVSSKRATIQRIL